jgi:putative ABC transport system permease protein
MLADKLRVGRGDEIQVISDIDLQEYTLTVAAVADSAAGEFMFMPLEQMNAILGMPAGSYIGIWPMNR